MRKNSTKSIRRRLLVSLMVSAFATVSLVSAGILSLKKAQSIVADASGLTTTNMLAYFRAQSSLEEILGKYESLVVTEGANALGVVGEIGKVKKKFAEDLLQLKETTKDQSDLVKLIEGFENKFVQLDELGKAMALDFIQENKQQAQEKMQQLNVARAELKAQGELVLQDISNFSVSQMRSSISEFVFMFSVAGVVFLILSSLVAYQSIVSINRDLMLFQNSLSLSLDKNRETIERLNTYSANLASSATQQNASVQESIAAMHEINRMLEKTSLSVSQCSGLMEESRNLSLAGEKSIAGMNTAMLEIEKSESDIKNFVEVFGQIKAKTEVINDIVFKTQLLSFNASIEAARAGQHGRGFAVVAEEVGQLAETSGKAASEIARLLSESDSTVNVLASSLRTRIGTGKEATVDILNKFSGIKANIAMVSEQMEEISSASQEQLIGTQEIAKAFGHLQESTQINNDTAANISEMAVSGVENNKSIDGVVDLVRTLLGFTLEEKKQKHPASVSKLGALSKKTTTRRVA